MLTTIIIVTVLAVLGAIMFGVLTPILLVLGDIAVFALIVWAIVALVKHIRKKK